MSRIILYSCPESPPARAVLMTAAALGIDLDIRHVDLSKKEQLDPAFIKMNPQHTVPTMNDNGTIIWDSHAINAYLVRKYGKDDTLYPKDFSIRAMVDQRLHFDSGVLFPLLRTIARAILFQGVSEIKEEWKTALNEGYAFLESFLSTTWLAGDSPTIADINMVATITSLDVYEPISTVKYPKVIAWIRACQNTPWYKYNEEGLAIFRNMFSALLNPSK